MLIDANSAPNLSMNFGIDNLWKFASVYPIVNIAVVSLVGTMAIRLVKMPKRLFLYLLVLLSTVSVLWFSFRKQGVALVNNSKWSTQVSNLTVSVSIKRTVQPILLFIGIYSAAKYFDRRNAIRETWMTECKDNEDVVCRFFTNRHDLKGNPLAAGIQNRLENESRLHGDLIYAESPPGLNFARRYLWMINWTSDHYDFKYLLRLDDDYFICFKKLVNELELHRPRHNFTWGWLHCFPGKCFRNYPYHSRPRKLF